jgi:hypothetical protein
MQFSYKTMWQKGLKYLVVFAIPFAVDSFIMTMPDIANLTIGSCLLMLVNVLKVKYGVRIP